MASAGCCAVLTPAGGLRYTAAHAFALPARCFSACLLSLLLLLAACDSEQNDPYPRPSAAEHSLCGVHRAPQASRSGAVVQRGRNHLYGADLRAAAAVPLPQAAVHADSGDQRERAGAALLRRQGRELPADAPAAAIARSVYEIRIRPGIRYQPHPAFATRRRRQPVYRDLDRGKLRGIETIADFAADRHARAGRRRLHLPDQASGASAPAFADLQHDGRAHRRPAELGAALHEEAKAQPTEAWLDLDRFPLAGVERVDRYTYRIRAARQVSAVPYWLAMPFFAPVPREVDRFYSSREWPRRT
jgi:oligopeptide transport system substrate-binding protein